MIRRDFGEEILFFFYTRNKLLRAFRSNFFFADRINYKKKKVTRNLWYFFLLFSDKFWNISRNIMAFFFCKMYTFLFNAKRTGYDGSDSTTRIVQYMSLLKNMKIKHVLLLYLRNGESVRINKGHTTSFGKMAKISKHVLFPDKNPLYM